MRLPRILCGLAAIACFPTPAVPQRKGTAAGDQPVISVNVNLVNLLCAIRDRAGAYIDDLTQNEVTVLEDGKPVRITHFTRQADSAVTVALLLDVTRSSRLQLDQHTQGAREFFHHVLRPGDRAMLAGFAAGIAVWQDLTTSKEALDGALEGVPKLAEELLGRFPRVAPQSGPVMVTIRCVTGGRLYDAGDWISLEKLQRVTGRKAIVALAGGGDCGSERSVNDAVRAAQVSDVVFYGVRFQQTSSSFGFDSLGELSGPTGGRTFQVSEKLPVNAIFAAIEEELRNQYAIAYTPPETGRKNALWRTA